MSTTTPPIPPTDPTEPVELQLFKSQTPTGECNIFARVLNIADKGINDQWVVFTLNGQQKIARTNDQGDAFFPQPLAAPADGKELKISAHISGIRNFSVIHIIRRVAKTAADIDRDARNNKRARWFLGVAGTLVVACVFIILFCGLGNPLVDFGQEQLTKQQKFFNEHIATSDNLIEKTAETGLSGKWQKPFFLIVLCWIIFSSFYWILAIREEAAEIIRQGIGKIADRRYLTSARDPLLERLMAFSGHLTSVRKPSKSGDAPIGAAKTKNTFWELLRSDLISDVLVEVIPGLLKIFRGR